MEQREIKLKIDGGWSRCSIFNVSSVWESDDRMSYRPRLVSIGPYHHGTAQVGMMEEHKKRYLRDLLRRIEGKGVNKEALLKKVGAKEAEARACYWSEFERFDSKKFAKMLLVDGCFVIEVVRRIPGIVQREPGDPLHTIRPIRSLMIRDLLLMENQILFEVLESLYNITRMPTDPDISLSRLVIDVFNFKLAHWLNLDTTEDPKHLLDLIRLSLMPAGYEDSKPQNKVCQVPNIRHLLRTGICFRRGDANTSPLAVRYQKGALIMPPLTLDDFTFPLFRNCVLLEQSSTCRSKHVTAYFAFLSYLIGSEEDMDYLCKKGIVVNSFSTNATMVHLIHQFLGGAYLNSEESYLSGLFKDVDDYSSQRRHVQLATFKYTYFRTPWTFISAVAAFLLLALTVISTVFTVLAYFKDDHN